MAAQEERQIIVNNLIGGCITVRQWQPDTERERERETTNPFAWAGIKIRTTYDYFMR